MRAIYIFLALSGIFTSCNNPRTVEDTNDRNYLIFGHFYGRCVGENCVETFKLTDKYLFEDTIDDYAGENLKFVVLENEHFERVKDLAPLFPDLLLQEKETVIGCPDCADGGGLFIELARNGKVHRWRIDQNKGNVPAYLHPFIDRVNAKIEGLGHQGNTGQLH